MRGSARRALLGCSLLSGEGGQGLVEYSLILAVMVVVCLVSLVFFGDQLSSILSLIASAV
jgi:Flp pilus assembly pilin Flp